MASVNLSLEEKSDGPPDLMQALFRHLVGGTWQLRRSMSSSNATEPSGQCYGQSTFTLRSVSDVQDDMAMEEMLYQEAGVFNMAAESQTQRHVPSLSFSRKYVWRLCLPSAPAKHRSGCSVWFVKPGTEEIDYLFHRFSGPILTSRTDNDQIEATVSFKGDHLCVNDWYNSEYEFTLLPSQEGKQSAGTESSELVRWFMRHQVIGPTKTQLIETAFTR